MIISIGFLLFLAISPCHSQSGSLSGSGAIKMVVMGKDTDVAWQKTIDGIALYIAKHQVKSPQIFVHENGSICEFIGGVDRSKMRADFILVIKKHTSQKLKCDPEWGRQSFGVLNIEKYPTLSQTDEDLAFTAKIIFNSSETGSAKPKTVKSMDQLIKILEPKFMAPLSRIPDEYPETAEREEKRNRRILKAIIALMGLALCSLLVIMFMGSLSRYNEAKKQKELEQEKQKKHEQKTAEKSEKAVKPEASEKSVKSEKSEKPQKAGEKEPLIDSSKKSEKSEKSEKGSGSKKE
ncbi:DsbC domain-containing protein [Caenorhabditis elegans]|uniref:DsbC domain-containing protein n=1 Tax=Caenorhabditis elegans TaxID=6239 RepID=O62520_CAEEL|nr:DsbC domain-containing protein [Caenorhabditis elegans]CAB05843.2 DsbC domain-containing protein [Caenorhabditis elegans]|eukprot:NP_502403.2 Uncharacterized protein CELE_ZK795.2 [Caenorhabditis elegans]